MTDETNWSRRSYLKAAGVTGATLGLSGCMGGGGDEFPSETITYIVPYNEGGGVDGYARGFAAALEETLGTTVSVQNIPGASAMRGLGELARADADGYTIGALTLPDNPLTALANPPAFDLQELEPIGIHGNSSWMFVANPEHGLEHDLEGMVEKYKNGEFGEIGGLGTATPDHAKSFVFKDSWEMPHDYVSYPGTSPVIQAAVSNEVPIGMGSDTGAASAVNSGDLDVVAAQSSSGSPVFPDAPTVDDAGFPSIDFLGSLTRGLVAPPGTPQDVVDTLESGLQEAVESEQITQWSEETGNPVEWGSASDLSDTVNTLFERIPEEVDLDNLSG